MEEACACHSGLDLEYRRNACDVPANPYKLVEFQPLNAMAVHNPLVRMHDQLKVIMCTPLIMHIHVSSMWYQWFDSDVALSYKFG